MTPLGRFSKLVAGLSVVVVAACVLGACSFAGSTDHRCSDIDGLVRCEIRILYGN